jgi:hypothetical protein
MPPEACPKWADFLLTYGGGMRTRTLLPAIVAALAVLVAGCSGGSSGGGAAGPLPHTGTATSAATQVEGTSYTSSTPCGWKSTTTYRHVIWIWMENRTYSSVLGSGASAPKLASYAGKCGLATRYYGVTHPSLPNYLAATSGSTGGVSTDCGPTQCPQQRSSLFGQVTKAGRQWRSYVESMPSKCSRTISGRYAPKHNPAVYYSPIRTQCRSWDVPMGGSSGAFATALSQRTLRAFSFVTPDMCHDGHDCSTSTADAWLGTWLGRIVTSAAYRAGDTAVFVTWDEGVGSDQHIATVVIAPTVPAGTRSSTHFTHYSLLRTTEQLLGLPALRAAADARSMRSAFHL